MESSPPRFGAFLRMYGPMYYSPSMCMLSLGLYTDAPRMYGSIHYDGVCLNHVSILYLRERDLSFR